MLHKIFILCKAMLMNLNVDVLCTLYTKNVLIIKIAFFIVAEKIISVHNLCLDGATLTVQKAKNQGHKGNHINM